LQIIYEQKDSIIYKLFYLFNQGDYNCLKNKRTYLNFAYKKCTSYYI